MMEMDANRLLSCYTESTTVQPRLAGHAWTWSAGSSCDGATRKRLVVVWQEHANMLFLKLTGKPYRSTSPETSKGAIRKPVLESKFCSQSPWPGTGFFSSGPMPGLKAQGFCFVVGGKYVCWRTLGIMKTSQLLLLRSS